MFKISEYWPPINETLTFTYFNADNSSANVASKFVPDPSTNSIKCFDFVNNQYQDTWYIRYDPNRGVVEWRDDMILSPPLSYVLGTTKKLVYKNNFEILWGNEQNIEDLIYNSIQVDPLKSVPPLPNSGWQIVHFTNHFDKFTDCIGQNWNDVLEFTYTQTWGNKTTGAIYKMAKGIGPVSINWIAKNENGVFVVGPEIAARVT